MAGGTTQAARPSRCPFIWNLSTVNSICHFDLNSHLGGTTCTRGTGDECRIILLSSIDFPLASFPVFVSFF